MSDASQNGVDELASSLDAVREMLDVVRKQLKAAQAAREDADRERDELRTKLLADPDPPTSASEPTTEKLEELDEDVPGVPPPLGKFDGSKLRYWRKERWDWSLDELSDKSGVSLHTIHRLERGHVKNPRHKKTVRALAEALQVPLEKLMT